MTLTISYILVDENGLHIVRLGRIKGKVTFVFTSFDCPLDKFVSLYLLKMLYACGKPIQRKERVGVWGGGGVVVITCSHSLFLGYIC